MQGENDDSEHDEVNNILAGQTSQAQENDGRDSTILNPDNVANTTIMKVHSQFGNFQPANPSRKETVMEKGRDQHVNDPFGDSDSSEGELMQGLGHDLNNMSNFQQDSRVSERSTF